MIQERLDQLELVAVDLVAKLSPWAAPLPTAYLVGRATVSHLAWPPGIAIVAALVVECLGLTTTTTALTLWNYNHDKRKSDPGAPFALAVALVGVYFVVATGLTVVLDIYHDLATYAPAIFPTLSLTGTGVLALRADHRRRLAAIETAKAARRAARQKRNKPARGPAQGAASVPVVTGTYAMTSQETRDQARAILTERPGISGSELGRQLGRSERLGRKLKTELLPEISGNGRAPVVDE